MFNRLHKLLRIEKEMSTTKPSDYVLSNLDFVYESFGGNESEAARYLVINRGTLQNYKSKKTLPSMDNANKIVAAAAVLRLQSSMNDIPRGLDESKPVYMQTVNAGKPDESQVICDKTQTPQVGDFIIVGGELAKWQMSAGTQKLPIAVTNDGQTHTMTAVPDYKVIGILSPLQPIEKESQHD